MLRCWTPPVSPGFQWMRSSAVRIGERQRGLAHMGQPPLSLSKNLWEVEKTWVWAGELEGAAARLEWDRMPRKPCRARLTASAARTFVPPGGTKVTAF